MLKVVASILSLIFVFSIAAVSNPDAKNFLSPHGGTSVGRNVPSDTEFNGPFPSWANVKTTYGAVGNGTTDDTAAFQAAFTDATAGTITTLWVPAGTYRIIATVILGSAACNTSPATGVTSFRMIGENPSTTTIKWDTGSGAGTIFCANGMDYSRVSRITFDGQNTASKLIDQSFVSSGCCFDTGNEYSDVVFKNAAIGFNCGGYGGGCSETSMLRNSFLNLSTAGIAMLNFNALDMWAWDSLFQNNLDAMTTAPPGGGAGNFSAFRSNFLANTHADIYLGNIISYYILADNFSSGSQIFLLGAGSNNPSNITMIGNKILDTTNSISANVGNIGPVVSLGNTYGSRSAVTTGPAVSVTGFIGPAFGNLFSLNDTFTVTSPTSAGGHSHTTNPTTVTRASISSAVPTLPPTPPNNHRTTFETSPSGSGTSCTAVSPCSIQTGISQATSCGTPRCVVHLLPSTYNVSATLTIPTNSDIQIVGDGFTSRLHWTGGTSGKVIQLTGPTQAQLIDFSVDGGTRTADGIVITNADQTNSMIYGEGIVLRQNNTDMLVNGLDYATIELHNYTHLETTVTGTHVIGGPQASSGNWQGGSTNIYGCLTANNDPDYIVSSGGHLLAQACFQEGTSSSATASISDASVVTLNGSALNYTATTSTSFSGFNGTAALVGAYPSGTIGISGNGSGANVLLEGMVGNGTSFFSNTSSPAATTEFLNGIETVSPGNYAELTEVPSTPNTSFLNTTLSQLLTTKPIAPLSSLPVGVTNIAIRSVSVTGAVNGIRLER